MFESQLTRKAEQMTLHMCILYTCHVQICHWSVPRGAQEISSFNSPRWFEKLSIVHPNLGWCRNWHELTSICQLVSIHQIWKYWFYWKSQIPSIELPEQARMTLFQRPLRTVATDIGDAFEYERHGTVTFIMFLPGDEMCFCCLIGSQLLFWKAYYSDRFKSLICADLSMCFHFLCCEVIALNMVVKSQNELSPIDSIVLHSVLIVLLECFVLTLLLSEAKELALKHWPIEVAGPEAFCSIWFGCLCGYLPNSPCPTKTLKTWARKLCVWFKFCLSVL